MTFALLSSNENANLQHAIKVEIVPLLELELNTDPCAVEVNSVEPLAVLLAKLGEQMMGGQKAIAAIFCTTQDHWIYMHLQAQGIGPCSYYTN